MICVILAAGYATRLYPLTENFPKPLLKVGEKTILDWLVDDISESGEADSFVLISNHKFKEHFEDWARTKSEKIIIFDDGTDSNENRLGAVRDIAVAAETLKLDDDLLVIAGDNVLDFSLNKFISYAKEKGTSAVMRYHEQDKNRLKKSGVISIKEGDLISDMEEKPENPKAEWCCPPFYFYTKEDAAKISEGIKNGCGVDAPGSFVAYLCKRARVYAMEMPGSRYDIGNLESYESVKREYRGIVK